MTDNHLVSMEDKEKIISQHPFFVLLPPAQITSLAELMRVKQLSQNELVVVEGSAIDNIYLIVEGEAEIKRKITTVEKSVDLPLAILHAGESIGMSDEGFYSQQGQRTASVIALTPMVLLEIDVATFTKFMHESSDLYPALKQQAEKMLRISFIKSVMPFMGLNITQISELADQIEAALFQKDNIIIRQGDIGDKVYLIQEGRVLIQHEDEEGRIRELAILNPPEIFGENALISSLPRNATAKTVTDVKLLSIDYKYLRKLMTHSQEVKRGLMHLTQDRRIPRKKGDATFTKVQKSGTDWLMFSDPAQHKYCYLPLGSEVIWEKINNTNSIAEIVKKTHEQFGSNGEQVVKDIINVLLKNGFITFSNLSESQSGFKHFIRKLFK